MALASMPVQTTMIRRSANYKPSIWSDEYIQSLGSNHVEESVSKRLEKRKEEVRMILMDDTVKDTLHQLDLIDTLQRLGVSYHFKNEIKSILTIIYNNHKQIQDSLYAVALEFRLLRQHGFDISPEIFSNFKDEKANFKTCLGEDCKGILNLYEAAYLLEEGEEGIFHDVRNFTTTYLKEYIKHSKDEYLSTLVKHSLDIPLYWRMQRSEARWFIVEYGKRKDANPILIELAKLDFNFVQAKHQEDLKHASSWWRNLSLHDHLSYARDCLVESFLWAEGSLYEPQLAYCRRLLAKISALATVVDDTYDVFGTLDELELFTAAIERWDVSAIDQLPQYMRILFLAIHNYINEVAFDVLKEQGIHIIPHLKKAWIDMCKAFLVEARWYNSGYHPTFEEFIDNAWTSIGGSLAIVHVYCFFFANPTEKEVSECLQEYHNMAYCVSLVIRYADDLGTSSVELERGDVPKSIQCYMHDTGVSEEDAREHIRELIITAWMKMNKERVRANQAFVEYGRNLMRTATWMFHHDHDAYTFQKGQTENYVLSLLVNRIPVTSIDG